MNNAIEIKQDGSHKQQLQSTTQQLMDYYKDKCKGHLSGQHNRSQRLEPCSSWQTIPSHRSFQELPAKSGSECRRPDETPTSRGNGIRIAGSSGDVECGCTKQSSRHSGWRWTSGLLGEKRSIRFLEEGAIWPKIQMVAVVKSRKITLAHNYNLNPVRLGSVFLVYTQDRAQWIHSLTEMAGERPICNSPSERLLGMKQPKPSAWCVNSHKLLNGSVCQRQRGQNVHERKEKGKEPFLIVGVENPQEGK